MEINKTSVDVASSPQPQTAATGVTAPATQQTQQVTVSDNAGSENLNSLVSDINKFVQNVERSIQFRISEETERPVVRVVNSETGELIREIPSEELQRISAAIEENLEQGLLIKVEA